LKRAVGAIRRPVSFRLSKISSISRDSPDSILAKPKKNHALPPN
jgi:hypothetical protein